MDTLAFLPVSKEDMRARDWYYYDYLVVTADAYVDHPSFGTSIIARVLEDEGFRVAILAQPDWHGSDAFLAMGKPRYGIFIGGGNIDSMVAHYTAAKKHRSEDLYSPGGRMGLRPDRPTIVYSNLAHEAFPDTPIIIGGLEASLRRFAHYDYWDDAVRRSILFDAPADLLSYGMGERATREIARRLAKGESVASLHDIRGTAFIAKTADECSFEAPVECPSFESVRSDKAEYAMMTRISYQEHDPIRGHALLQRCGKHILIVNPPQLPLTTEEMDAVYALPYTREVHPMYESLGGVAAIEEVRFSVVHNRGCFGNCNFCALTYHQGRMISVRSEESVVKEVEGFTRDPLFKGYVHDVGGPTANFRHNSCKKQAKCGMCRDRDCLAPTPCKNLDGDHSEYLHLLRRLRAIPGVKKVFVRSGIRFDYLLQDKDDTFFNELVKYHISGQLKVAPEHAVDSVLDYMGKPHFEVYEQFLKKYQKLNEKANMAQFLVPYLMSSHPGCTLNDAVELAEYLHSIGHMPQQVQDFYPTPGTISTCMYYTGLDPETMEPVYVAKTPHDKALQRALLQWRRPENRKLVREALYRAHREDLIGYGKNCLIRPLSSYKDAAPADSKKAPRSGKAATEKSRNTHAGEIKKAPQKQSAEKKAKPAGKRVDSGRKAPMSAAKKERFLKKRGK